MSNIKSVETAFGAPIGARGFRSGVWTATRTDGTKFKFYSSVPHSMELSDQELALIADAARIDKLRNMLYKGEA